MPTIPVKKRKRCHRISHCKCGYGGVAAMPTGYNGIVTNDEEGEASIRPRSNHNAIDVLFALPAMVMCL